jgi:hypothetical protein
VVKRVAARVNSVEAQLERAVFYEQKTEDPATESTRVERAWFTEAGDWLKVSGERSGKGRRGLTEVWFGEDNAPVFLLLREEGPPAAAPGAKAPEGDASAGATRVQELRRYYNADRAAVRELRKDAVFKAGEPLDTVAVKNVSQRIADLPEEERSSQARRDEAQKLIEFLVKAGPPKRDPGAGDPGDSKRFRIIKESTSPDGRYAVAIGFAEAPKSWDDFYLVSEYPTEKEQFWIEDWNLREEKLRNYVVDLTTHRIVGETGGNAYGTKTSIGRGNWSHIWSPDSRWLVQVICDKWRGRAAALAIDPERGVVASGDLTAQAEQRAVAFLKAKKDPTLKRLGTDLSVLIHRAELTNEGTVTIDLLPTEPGNPKSWDSPSLVERLRVKQSGAKVEVKFLEARYE